ncbi:hypothetical protein PJL18_02043 [Paenarthrobacter nicotinovorans]|nr:hypothetical protein [Paenarthrobacter nicotinovorans]
MRHAGGGNHDVGLLEFRGQVHGSGVGQDDRCVDFLAGQQQSDGTADGHAAANHQDALALEVDVVAAKQLHTALGRAGQRRLHFTVHVGHQAAKVHGVQAVGVLLRVHGFQDDVLVDVLGKRELDDVAGALGVLVEFLDDLQEVFLGDVLGEVAADGLDAHLCAVLVLAADIPGAAGVGAHQDGAQAGDDALGGKGRNAGGQFCLDGSGGGLAVKDLCGGLCHYICSFCWEAHANGTRRRRCGGGSRWLRFSAGVMRVQRLLSQEPLVTTARAAGTAGSCRRACRRVPGEPLHQRCRRRPLRVRWR